MSLHDEIMEIIETNGNVSFSRSSGPGGQNVNKVNTSVLLALPLDCLGFLGSGKRELLLRKLSGRINSNGELYVRCQKYRSQHMNRTAAVLKLAELITDALKTAPARKRTRPSKASKEKRLNDKKRRSALKKERRSFD